MMRKETARLIARDWHGGETTALYKFWRTGRLDCFMAGIEVNDAMKYANPRERNRLKLFAEYLRSA